MPPTALCSATAEYPTPVCVYSQRPLSRMSRLLDNDKDDNEVKLGAVLKFPNISFG